MRQKKKQCAGAEGAALHGTNGWGAQDTEAKQTRSQSSVDGAGVDSRSRADKGAEWGHLKRWHLFEAVARCTRPLGQNRAAVLLSDANTA